MFNESMVDKNEKYDKSCKNAMNVVMSKKSLKRFMIQFVKKNFYQEASLPSQINIEMSHRSQRQKEIKVSAWRILSSVII